MNKNLLCEIEREQRNQVRLNDVIFKRITELELFKENILLAIEQLKYGTPVEEAATFENNTNGTRDYLHYMALLKLAIEKTMEKK